MTAHLVNGTLDGHGSDGRLGPQAALEAPDGALPGSFPQPPPPPPPPVKNRPVKQAARQAGGVWDRLPSRYKIAVGGVAVIASTVTFTRMFVHPVDENALRADITNDVAGIVYNEVLGDLNAAKAESTQIAVPSPFSWAKCQLSTDAKVMIGGDPSTGGKTLNQQRASVLEQQATVLLSQFRMVDLRLTAPAVDQLRVVADNPTVGVPLFACEATDAAEPAPTTTAAPAS